MFDDEVVIIPSNLQDETTYILHESHLGYESMSHMGIHEEGPGGKSQKVQKVPSECQLKAEKASRGPTCRLDGPGSYGVPIN